MKKLIFILVIALTALSASAAEDAQRKSTVHLKSGEYITGQIKSRTSAQVEIVTEDGITYVYDMADVNYISHERKQKNYDTAKFRGFIDVGYAFGVGSPRGDYWTVETSFGYMITPRVYVGAGIGLQKFNADIESFPLRYDGAEPEPNDPDLDDMPFIPLYADVRYNLGSENHNTPWAGLRIGGSIFNHGGFYLSPSIGYHFASSQFFSFNVSAGYALHTAGYKLWCRGETEGAIADANGGAYLDKTAVLHNIFVKVGVEF